MKTLVLLGSPRKNGDSVFLARELVSKLEGEVTWLSAYRDNLSPCIDCRGCFVTSGCVISDDMQVIYGDDYSLAVLATPVYMSSLPGPLVSVLSRFQAHYAALRNSTKIEVKPKRSALILTGGGNGAPGDALRMSRLLLRHMGAQLNDDDIITSLKTDSLPAREDIAAIEKTREVAARLMHKDA